MRRGDKTGGRRVGRPGRGALVIIAGLFVMSAMMRMGGSAGEVFARAGDLSVSELPPAKETAEAPDFQAMLDAFRAREAKIAEQEAVIVQRRDALRLADEEITRKLARLEAAEARLAATLTQADSAAEDDISRLTKVYETMKPKQAAALFEEMNASFAAGFLARMRPDAAAGIMAGLSAGAAHEISVALASRNASVPTE